MSVFPSITISGPPRERGQSYGEQARPYIERAIATYRRGFEPRGLTWARVKEIGAEFALRAKQFSEEMHEELIGISEGSGFTVGEIVALNARTELLFSATGFAAPRELGGEGCTGAIAFGEATDSGHVVHGQNWDWRGESAEFAIVLRIEPENGPTILTLVEAGTLARCGMNSAGIAITGNFLKSETDFEPSGVPAPFVRRKVLMAENFHDAMLAVTSTRRSFSINVMISDGAGEAINFETTPDRLFWLHPQKQILVHANHFSSPGALASVSDLSLEVTPDSLFRERRVRDFLDKQHGSINIGTLKEIFKDLYGAPYAIFRDGDGSSEDVVTVATVLMDVTGREMSVARGRSDETVYRL